MIFTLKSQADLIEYMFKLLIISIFLVSCSSTVVPVENKKVVSSEAKLEPQEISNTEKVVKYCEKIEQKFKKLNWSNSHCTETQWSSVRASHYGNPIMWTSFEDVDFEDTIILMCGVHPDEITPVKFCFDIIEDLKKRPELYKKRRIVIAPIVTPDPFFYKKPTRTNSRGVDVNRNFPTKDWNEKALQLWETKYYKNKRRFPGDKPLSEQETIFQVNLIKLYKPSIVISVHAPLQLLDYDGPSFGHGHGESAKNLLSAMSSKAGNYKVANYPFYPGSLGNWSGNERSIPTFTLELPNSDWNKTDRYFKKFSPAVYHAFQHQFKK